MHRDPHISLRKLSRRFPEGGSQHRVLQGVDLDIGRGEMVALLGPSGSGKSTLLNLISGIDLPDEGEITIAGTSLCSLTEKERTLFRRRHVGFVYQFFNLLPTLSVQENVELPLELNGLEHQRSRAVELLDSVGLKRSLGRFPDTLSGGEQQRVAIVRALIHGPQVLLADEPTGNLDEETGDQVLDVLEQLVRGDAVTMLVATHSRRVATRCDRVLALQQGTVRERA